MRRVNMDVGGMTLTGRNGTKRETCPMVTLSMRWVLSIGNNRIFFTQLTIKSWLPYHVDSAYELSVVDRFSLNDIPTNTILFVWTFLMPTDMPASSH